MRASTYFGSAGVRRVVDQPTIVTQPNSFLQSVSSSGAISLSITAQASEVAGLTASGILAGSSLGHATESATLTALGKLAASSTGHAVESATVKATGKLSGSSLGTASQSSLLKAAGKLLGTFLGTASEIAALKGTGKLLGSPHGQASVIGTLSSGGLSQIFAVFNGHGQLIGTFNSAWQPSSGTGGAAKPQPPSPPIWLPNAWAGEKTAPENNLQAEPIDMVFYIGGDFFIIKNPGRSA